MIELGFAITGVEAAARSAAPLLLFKLRAVNTTPEVPVEHVALTAQVRIEAAHREYPPEERETLSELFGSGGDWDRLLRGMLWTNVSIPISGFTDQCAVDLPVPCSYDFSLAATKYFYGLQQGDAPLLFLFSGTVFFRDPDADLQIAQIAHHKEAGFRLPAQVWRALMERHYGDQVPVPVSRAVFDELYRYKRRHALRGWDEALQRLLECERSAEPVP